MISFTHLNKKPKGGKGVQDAVKNTDIETMKLAELKEYAVEIGCDIENIKNHAQAKKMVKDFLIAQDAEQNNEPKADEQGEQPSNSADETQDDEKNDNSGDEADADQSQEDVEKE